MGRFDALYARLPVWGQNQAVTFYGYYWKWLRFGGRFQAHVRAFQERERFPSDEWSQWQQKMIKQVLSDAAAYVPYYRDTWTTAQKQAAQSGELTVLPLLEKDSVRANPQAFLRQDMNSGRRLTFHTSGSTGTPIASIWTVDELRQSMALREVRSASWANTSFKEPRATFSGRLVEPDPDSKGPYYRFNRAEQQAYFSAFHLRPDTAHFYVQALHRHQIRWLTGYAVSYYLLARFILERQLSPPPLQAVITTSEKVTPEMRQIMKDAYQCPVFEEYSTVENVLFAQDCEQGRLHVSPDAGLVEILRPDGFPCAPGEVGEVVATALIRVYQPLIRYRLGDLAAWSEEVCPCGRNLPILKEVVGRIEDVIVGPDGRQMVRFHGIFVNQPHIQEGQIIQENIRLIKAKVVTTPDYNLADEQDIRQRIQQRLGTEVDVIVEPVSHIPRTPAGKFQAVISRIQ